MNRKNLMLSPNLDYEDFYEELYIKKQQKYGFLQPVLKKRETFDQNRVVN